MTIAETAGALNAEDTGRLLLIEARRNALEINPDAFSQGESVEIVRASIVLIGELLKRYDIDEGRQWHISKYTGVITYED